MEKRKKGNQLYNEELKLSLLKLWKESGMNRVDFAERHGINKKTFSNWYYAELNKKSSLKWLEAKVEDEPKEVVEERGGALEIKLLSGISPSILKIHASWIISLKSSKRPLMMEDVS